MWIPPPITHIESSINRLLYAHIEYPSIFKILFSVLSVLGLKKISNFDNFSTFHNQNLFGKKKYHEHPQLKVSKSGVGCLKNFK